MPRIRFIKLACPCGADYRVRLDRVAGREPFECLSCGNMVNTEPYAEMLEMIYQYSGLILKMESVMAIEGDTAA